MIDANDAALRRHEEHVARNEEIYAARSFEGVINVTLYIGTTEEEFAIQCSFCNEQLMTSVGNPHRAIKYRKTIDAALEELFDEPDNWEVDYNLDCLYVGQTDLEVEA